LKTIDLHIHTIPTISDSDFAFDLNALANYIKTCSVDGIAVTNHNIFDLNQYREIEKCLEIPVYPGVEINIENGHLLLISDICDLSDFQSKCLELSRRIVKKEDSIKASELKTIFGDLNRYLLIPHYDKDPALSESALLELRPFISAGEVNSPKKFIYCIKDPDSLVPVYFSDCRFESKLGEFPTRKTFINCGDMTFNAIKSCLRDKSKVFLSLDEGRRTFQIFSDGQKLSTGLNVIIGERSTGKSFTLKRIFDLYPDVKYIRQFSLVERDEQLDEEKFGRLLSQHHSLFTQDYLKEYMLVVNDVSNVDIEMNDNAVLAYMDSLKRHAIESEKQDAYSKARLFGEEPFQIVDSKGLRELIESVIHLIENIEYREIIQRYVSLAALRKLVVALIMDHSRKEEERLKKHWINDLITDIKKSLQLRTAATIIKEVDLYNTALDQKKRQRFIVITNNLRRERTVMEKNMQGFKVVATVGRYGGAGELKTESKSKIAFKSVYQSYDDPYQFLKCLKAMDDIPKSEYYRYFAKVTYKILNSDGFEVSGGERSEYNLLQEIDDAQKYDMLLIDEPESSFDNIFLKSEVNKMIKDISLSMPVVLVTHNNSVGASIMPDYILCTKKEITGKTIDYRIYSGFPSDQDLKSTDGKAVKNIDMTLSCLEAGKEAYEERSRLYADIENR
jgi:ABC-type dipeptide/oligopeptide/nickel transport system ATPase component